MPHTGPPGEPYPSPVPAYATEPAGPADALAPLLERELRPDLVLIRPLGSGRSGRVFLAREPRLNRLVAVKVLSPELAGNAIAGARFEREARAVAALNHPNAVAVHRFGYLTTGVPFLVMQYVKGVTMEEKLAAEGLLSVAETRRVLAEIADALGAAHRRGFVHRDLRPDNVLWDNETGRVLVSDFGLAGILPGPDVTAPRITQFGEILGALEYTSPEQLRGEPASEGTDVYALGIMGYRFLTGAGPFGDATGIALSTAHLRAPPPRLRLLREDVDEKLEALLEKCLAKDAGKRPRAAYVAQVLREEIDAARAQPSPAGQPAETGTDFLSNLMRRRLPQIVAVTAAAGYAALSFIDQLADRGLFPEIVYRLSLSTFIFGVGASGVIAWFHGTAGRQRVSPLEAGVLGLVTAAWLITCLVILLA